MYKKELQIGEQMPSKRIDEAYLPLIVFYCLLLKMYLLENILPETSLEQDNLGEVGKQVVAKC
jgi:hypothetical protein